MFSTVPDQHSPAPQDGAENLAATPSDDDMPTTFLRYRYALAAVEEAANPSGDPGSDWYRYILASGTASIIGYHRGTLEEVTAFAHSCAEDFNARNAVGWKTMSGSPRKTRALPTAPTKARCI